MVAGVLVLELDEDLDVGLAAQEFYVYGVVAVGNQEAFVLVGGDHHRGLRTAVDFSLFGLAVGSFGWLAHAVRAELGTRQYFGYVGAERSHRCLLSDSNCVAK